MTITLLIETLKLPLLLIVVLLNTTLAHIVTRDNKKSPVNKIFFWLCISTSFWLIFSYLAGSVEFPGPTLWYARMSLFAAVFQGYLILLLAHTFPNTLIDRNSRITLFASALALTTSCLTLTPLVFTGTLQDVTGTLHYGVSWGMPIFVITMTIFSIGSVVLFIQKLRVNKDEMRNQFQVLLTGILLMIGLIIVTIMLPFVFFQYTAFLGIAPLYVGIFLSMTAYAIVKYRLFNVRLIAVEIFVSIISLVYFFKAVAPPITVGKIVDGLIFILTVFFGFLLVRSVKKEIQQREEISALAEQLSGANTDLERSNERLRIIDQRKSEFVSIVSHQLRTPITAIKGYTSLLLENSFGPISDTVRPPIEKIYVSSKRLAEMVTDFLNISKIEQGTMTYVLKPVDIGAMITDLCDDFAQVASMKDIELRLHIPKKEKFIATADDGKLRQIFSNLIDNSIKYTPTGSVDVSLESDKERGLMLVKLKDTGIGLSQDDIHHLFGKFTRGIDGQRQNTEGSGLGLYVAKKMLEAQGGDVFVESEGPGKGSTFAIELKSSDEFQ